MITKEEIKKLADLSRMEMSLNEIDNFTGEVDSILQYVGQISKIDGSLAHTTPKLRNVMRDDTPQNTSGQYTEDILKNAPARQGNYLKVKKILGNSDDII